MTNPTSEGKCLYCDKYFSGAGISRHLGTHLKKSEKDSPTKHTSYHVKVKGYGPYFLHLLVSEKIQLADLDQYLKSIWLECCGHMSAFHFKGDYSSDLNMRAKVGSLFEKGVMLDYEYDFGSTTQLEISIMGEYMAANKEGITLLSRNESPKIMCSVCRKKPAQVACSVCIYDEESHFCGDCEDIHAKTCEDFADYAGMEIVNSPRSGVCAYEGGSIDTERDGVWQERKQ